MRDKTTLVRNLIPKSYHFDGYNIVNCPNSRDRPFFSDGTVSLGDIYHLSTRLIDPDQISIEFSSVCPKGKYIFKPYLLSLDGFIRKLQQATGESSDFITFSIPVERNTVSCKNCEYHSRDCSQLNKTQPKKIMAAVSFDTRDIKEALASYYEIFSTKKGSGIMRKKNNFLGVNFEFGIVKDSYIASTLMGIAVKNPSTGNWYIFDKDNKTIKNMAGIKIGSFPLFALPKKDLAAGDLIKRGGEYYYVQEAPANGNLSLIKASDGTIVNLVPEESLIPGMNFYTVIMAIDPKTFSSKDGNPMGNIFSALLLMKWSKGGSDSEFSLDDINDESFNGLGKYWPIIMMAGGTNMFGGGGNNPLNNPLMLMALGGDGDNDDMMQMMVISSLLGGNTGAASNPFASVAAALPDLGLGAVATGEKVKCEKCGAEYEAGTNFCSKCGGKTVSVSAVVCKKCGKVLKADDMFCSNCGTKVGPATCPKCGAEVADDAAFCSKCGANLKGEPAKDEAPAEPEKAPADEKKA